MIARIVAFVAVVALVAGCSSTPMPSLSRSPETSPTSAPTSAPAAGASGPIELSAGALSAGTYTRAGFLPPITFTIDDGWVAGTLDDGFFDIQQLAGTPDVIAVQFALVEAVAGAGGAMIEATTAAAATDAIAANPGLAVLGESESLVGGTAGLTIQVENNGTTTTPVMQVAPGTLAFDPERRLWISVFDTADGLLAVMVGGSMTRWDDALTEAEPVLGSVIIGG